MKRLLTFLWCAVAAMATVASAAPATPDLIARIHFVGAGQVAADPNAAAFTKLWCSPEALALRAQTLDKLSRAPYAWFKAKLNPGTGNGAPLLRPLLDDLLTAEWFLQIRDSANGSPEYALAIHLDAARARVWQANLQGVIESWTGMAVQKRPDGWSLKKHLPPDQIRFVRTGDWVIFGCGQDDLPVNDELARQVAAQKRPAPVEKDVWLTAEVDWPRLARWFPAINPFDLPETRVRLVGRNHDLDLDGQLVFPQPLALNLEKWRMPTDQIRQPIASFTAVRGIAPWLKKQTWAQPYEISPVPNQMFIWGMGSMPLQTFTAVPVPNGRAALKELAQKFSANPDWKSHLLMPITMEASADQISWRGVPFVAPTVRAVHEPTGDFLVSEFFPNGPPSKQPLPADLSQELGRANLLGYHWENTPQRLKQLPQLTQLALLLTHHRQLDVKSAAGQWLTSIGPTLGNAVTEVTQTAPNVLAFSQKAGGGLTAIELIALANWLEAPNFPGCDLKLPPPAHPLKFHPRPTAPGTPPPFQLH